MRKIFISLVCAALFNELFSQELVIQENELGFCPVNGKIDTGSKTIKC